MKIYIAGKITGESRASVAEKFSNAMCKLKSAGHLPFNPSVLPDYEEVEKDKNIVINTKEEYDKVQNELLLKGYKWIDGTDTYYDLFNYANDFYKITFIIHHEDKTFEWRDVEVEK